MVFWNLHNESIAGFEEHSKRRMKRKRRPESLTNQAATELITGTSRTPLSPRSKNIGTNNGNTVSRPDTNASPKSSFLAGVPAITASSRKSPPALSALQSQHREVLQDNVRNKQDTQALSPSVHQVPSQPSAVRSPALSRIQDPKFNDASPVPTHPRSVRMVLQHPPPPPA